ncbi:hypothetical protein MBANPS3_004974 [Mucor bainieri]
MEEPHTLPLQFQLLFNWEIEATTDALLKHRTRMYPTFKVDMNNTAIYRLIHHEFDRHYISAGQLFKANGITLTEGLFLFNLKMTDFEVDFLIAQFPFCDIWVSVDQARHMALALGVEHELGFLLGEEINACFSSDNISRNEMMHNWTVPAIPHLQYSTRALIETTFEAVDMLEPSNRKIRTQIARSKQKGMVMKDRAESGLVRWQVWAYEQFLQQNAVQDEQPVLPILDRSGSVWDALQGILSDLQNLTREGGHGTATTNARVLSDNMVVGNMPLKKEYLNQSLLLQQLYTAVMAEKIMNEIEHLTAARKANWPKNLSNNTPQETSYASSQQEDAEKGVANTASTATTTATTHANRNSTNNMLFHDRMDLIEQELYRNKRKSKKRMEEMELSQQEIISQLNDLKQWKIESERKRRSERLYDGGVH